MTRHRQLDDVLREWVDHGDERLPQHNLAAALAEIETTPQRGARPALLEGVIMRIQPLAVPLAIAAVLVVAIGAFALVSRPPSVGPMPSPSTSAVASQGPVQMNGELSTDTFGVPLTISLPSAPDPDGWYVTEGAALISIAAGATSPDRLVIVDPAQANVLDETGVSSALPSDLVAWLDGQPGIAAEPLQAFDREGQAAYTVEGQEVPVFTVTIDPEGGSRTFVDTADGPALETPQVATTWWLLPFESDRGDLLMFATSEQDGAQAATASYLAMMESIALR